MFKVITDHPIALESMDHIDPHGSKNDNSINHRFNDKIYRIVNKKPMYILDIGCAGGGFVKSCIDDGHLAIGLEGSDYSYKHQRAEWAIIPNNLFTCDVTYPFQIQYNGQPVLFDLITAWEFAEHISEDKWPQLTQNLISMMHERSLLIMSISMSYLTLEDHKYHICIRPVEWWIIKFIEWGFVLRQDIMNHFKYYEYVRFDPNILAKQYPNNFAIILQRAL